MPTNLPEKDVNDYLRFLALFNLTAHHVSQSFNFNLFNATIHSRALRIRWSTLLQPRSLACLMKSYTLPCEHGIYHSDFCLIPSKSLGAWKVQTTKSRLRNIAFASSPITTSPRSHEFLFPSISSPGSAIKSTSTTMTSRTIRADSWLMPLWRHSEHMRTTPWRAPG